MKRRQPLLLLPAWAICLLVSSCVTAPQTRPQRQSGESVVFVGDEPAALAWLPLPHEPVRVRASYEAATNVLNYEAGRDFAVDYGAGTLRRLPGSRLPDFRTNSLFGRQEFDHSKFPGFGNRGFFAFVDYSFSRTEPWPRQDDQTRFLPASRAKLAAGGTFKLVAFGDSISAGGDASRPDLIFWQRWAEDLRRHHPGARITAVNGATGGDSTVQALQRLQAKVLDEKPDLVLVGFGMNDHNRGGVPLAAFEGNLAELIARIRSATSAEVVLFSAFPPNPQWKFGSHRMAEYARATERAAQAAGCAYADVFDNWETVARRKKPEDLLANNINHPNDFGHWVYYRVLCDLGL